MAINNVVLSGRIPFEFEVKGDDGKEFVMFSMSVQRDWKSEGEQYYPEDLITCKAFRHTAKFLGEYFQQGSHLQIVGSVRRDDDYEKDGQTVRGQMYVLVDKVYFPPRSNDNASTAKDKAPAKPAATKKPSPFLKGKKDAF